MTLAEIQSQLNSTTNTLTALKKVDNMTTQPTTQATPMTQEELSNLVEKATARNTRMLTVKYLSPTNTKGSRIKIIDRYFGKSITLGYNYQYTSALRGAVEWLIKNGWDVQAYNSEACKDEYVVVIGTWDSEQQLNDK